MRKPVIGITTGRLNEATQENEIQTPVMGCPIQYPYCVQRSGGAPVLLPRIDDKETVASVMSSVDGLLLSGGGDVVSLLYGEEPHIATLNQDPVRDSMELEALRIGLDAGLPVLAICRGMEVLNIACGGTLVQDIPSDVPNAIQHYAHARDTVLSHTIDIEAETLLARVLGTTSTPVNSWHHQGVRDVGTGLRVNCRARDGVIEGIEAADGSPILAVQFHPEDCAEDYPLFQRLFDWLVSEAAGE